MFSVLTGEDSLGGRLGQVQRRLAVGVADVGVGAVLEQDCAGETEARAELGQAQADPANTHCSSRASSRASSGAAGHQRSPGHGSGTHAHAHRTPPPPRAHT